MARRLRRAVTWRAARSPAGDADRSDQDALARRSLLVVGLLAGDRDAGVVDGRHAGPQRDRVALVEAADGNQHAGRVLQPRLVKAAAVEAGKSGGVELDPPSRR